MILTRRNFLKGLAGAVAAPAIIVGGIKRGVIMPVKELVVPEVVPLMRVTGTGFFPGDIVQLSGTTVDAWWNDELLLVERITSEGIFVKRAYDEHGIPFPVQQPERMTRIGHAWEEGSEGPHARAAWQAEQDDADEHWQDA